MSQQFLEEFSSENEKCVIEFLKNRNLWNPTSSQTLWKENHEQRLENELKINNCLMKYRQNPLNLSSHCDSQFVNNLHSFYGNGSQLTGREIVHYAQDRLEVMKNDSKINDASILKKLPVVRKSEKLSRWFSTQPEIENNFRRSKSVENLEFEEKPKIDLNQRLSLDYSVNDELLNVDENFQLFTSSEYKFRRSFYKKLCQCFAATTKYVNGNKITLGWNKIGQILFTTPDKHGYACLAENNEEIQLKTFSDSFKTYLEQRSEVHEREAWKYKNVAIFIEEYVEESTQFRRARHLGKYFGLDWFLEMDTGRIRSLKDSSPNYVMRLPDRFSLTPPLFFEFRFQPEMTQKEIQQLVAEIRETRQIYVTGIDTINRLPMNGKKNDFSTCLIGKPKKQENRKMTQCFCDEPNCSWMCGVSKFYEKTKQVEF